MTRRTLAVVVGVGGVVLAAGLLLRQSETFGGPQRVVELTDATATTLDTVAVRGRIVRASVSGIVVQIGTDGQVWLSAGGDAFPLRFPSEAGVAVEDRVLATGRVRARGGTRWLAVSAWSVVEPAIQTPSALGL